MYPYRLYHARLRRRSPFIQLFTPLFSPPKSRQICAYLCVEWMNFPWYVPFYLQGIIGDYSSQFVLVTESRRASGSHEPNKRGKGT